MNKSSFITYTIVGLDRLELRFMGSCPYETRRWVTEGRLIVGDITDRSITHMDLHWGLRDLLSTFKFLTAKATEVSCSHCLSRLMRFEAKFPLV